MELQQEMMSFSSIRLYSLQALLRVMVTEAR
jgi:hypothetical protein